MTIHVKPSLGEMTWLIGRGDSRRAPLRTLGAKLLLLSVVVVVGFVSWMVLPGASDAGGDRIPTRSPAMMSVENKSWLNPAITPTEATLVTSTTEAALATPADATMPLEAIPPVEAAPIDGLKISSQHWRRGGLGSKALVTFTLRNGNDYAVKDIELFCSFARRDGSHLTDRTRMIHDIVNMKSRKTFARMHVGFVNVNADQAKCSLVAASRI
jgi:hypothetical protein